MRFATIALFFSLIFLNHIKLKAQDTCSFVNPEAAGVLPPPPLEQYCEDEEGNTIFYQFINTGLGSYCDMGAVANGYSQSGDIDYSEMRLWDYMEALLDACARDTLCNGGYYNTGQQTISIPFDKYCIDPDCTGQKTKINVFNSSAGGQYNGNELDQHFDWYRWTAEDGKNLLPDPTGMCSGDFCGKWLIDDYELNGSSTINMEVTYKLACCPCEDQSGGNDLPGGGQIGNGNE